MSWHFSRALVEAFSAAICSDGEPSARLNTTPMPEAYYWPDKTTEHSRLSRFGMTSEPLMANRGEELLMSYREGFRAKTSARLVRELESTENDQDYGAKWQESFARYDRDSSSWKTAQCSLLGGLEKFSGTWPRWGLMRSGASYLQPTPAHLTSENASGSLPTPLANKHSGKNREDFSKSLHVVLGGPVNPEFAEWMMGWPIGWTDLKPLETAKFQKWQQQHSITYEHKTQAV